MTKLKAVPFSLIARVALAIVLALGLLVFLAAVRLTRASQVPVLTLRALDSAEPVSLPVPTPPMEAEEPPPPVPAPDLPKLTIEYDSVAPPILASPNQEVNLRLKMADFASQVEQAREHMTFAASDLDSQPRLINRPTVPFPASQKSRGVKEGRVTLEVIISNRGKITVRRVLESSHPDFTKMARSFAMGSRFTAPQKDGRSVTALFKWPLILRP